MKPRYLYELVVKICSLPNLKFLLKNFPDLLKIMLLVFCVDTRSILLSVLG